jgi:putative ATP-dependent endonuclease of OLD family
MKIQKITIHNFRSVIHESFYPKDFSLLVGHNNAGKTNVLRAIRVFYEDLKFNRGADFPKKGAEDNESWIEVEFLTTDDEQASLKDEYKSSDCILRIRKVLLTELSPFKDKVKPNQSNMFAYEDGKLSDNFFYGTANVSQSKIGNVIYIPEISKVGDSLKTSGPSHFRDVLNFVIKQVVAKSQAYTDFETSFDAFKQKIKSERTVDGHSLDGVESDLNDELKDWGVSFNIDVNNISTDVLVKELMSHSVVDSKLDGQAVSIDDYGQGMQRHVIYSLIVLANKYRERKAPKDKKEFNTDFNLVLFEEPEAFLHPSQQQNLNYALRRIASDEDNQIIATTHSPTFACDNIEQLTALHRINREPTSTIHALETKEEIEKILDLNNSLFKAFEVLYNNPKTTTELKTKITKSGCYDPSETATEKLRDEGFKYALWLDSERSSMFFANLVLICEGATEKRLIDKLVRSEWPDFLRKGIYVLDAAGKFNIHRYMNLLDCFGIPHSILFDDDNDANIHKVTNDFINKNKKSTTRSIYSFKGDLEGFLSVSKPKSQRDKPLSILKNYSDGKITIQKISDLKKVIESLI